MTDPANAVPTRKRNDAHRFDVRFDPGGLAADVARLAPEAWTTHYNTRDYDGEWTGVALRCVAGSAVPLFAGHADAATFADAAVLDRCPAIRDVLRWFRCPLKSVRLLKLGAGATIREHRDHGLGLDEGEARIHIPIATNPGVEFFLNDEPVPMAAGEVWYLDLSQPHRVKNRGATDRIHLVVDCVANDWLRSLFETEGEGADQGGVAEAPQDALGALPSRGGLEEFRALVLRDVTLQERLCEVLDPALFVTAVVRRGRELGYMFTVAEVEQALMAGRRHWILRWMR